MLGPAQGELSPTSPVPEERGGLGKIEPFGAPDSAVFPQESGVWSMRAIGIQEVTDPGAEA